MSSKWATPYQALAIGLPSVDLERVRRELEMDTALWIDRVDGLEQAHRHLRAEHDVVLLRATSPDELPHAAALLRSRGEGRKRGRLVLAILTEALAHGVRIPGIEKVTVAPLRASPLREILAAVGDPPCPYPVDDGMADLASDYLASRRADVAALWRDLEAGDHHAVAERAHRFKGTGAVYGFPQISAAGAGIETAARRAREPEVRTWIRALGLYLEGMEASDKVGGCRG